jgi:prepilin-type N-terminal cleavage/methylation domain-containing protein
MFFPIKRTFQKNKGFGLIETLVAVTIFSVVAFSVYVGFAQIFKVMNALQTKNLAINLANEQIEIIRSLSYENIVLTGETLGVGIPQIQNITREGNNFSVTTDIAGTDYKTIGVEVQCQDCNYQDKVIFNTIVAR